MADALQEEHRREQRRRQAWRDTLPKAYLIVDAKVVGATEKSVKLEIWPSELWKQPTIEWVPRSVIPNGNTLNLHDCVRQIEQWFVRKNGW